MDAVLEAIEITRTALLARRNSTWIVAFSGGKDSSALLKIFCAALKQTPDFAGRVVVVYCDTGVESPVLDAYVRQFFMNVTREFSDRKLPIETLIVNAPIEKRFFVKIVGRGYPPPTNAFRWCTKHLRIAPVAQFIETSASCNDVVVAIGSRAQESEQRRRSVLAHGAGHWQVQKESRARYDLFLPLLNLSVESVWDAVFSLGIPNSLDSHALERLYRGAAGECPVIKEVHTNPCSKGRFGCWTCTVVRRDRSAEGLIQEGYVELKPYLDLRNWLAEFRNDVKQRWPVRRSGREAPGPFSISARLKIFSKLLELEKVVNQEILSLEERAHIQSLMLLDVDLERQIFGRSTASSRRIRKQITSE